MPEGKRCEIWQVRFGIIGSKKCRIQTHEIAIRTYSNTDIFTIGGVHTMITRRLRLPRWFSFLSLLIAFVLLRFSLGLRVVPTFSWLFPVLMIA